MVVGVDEVHYTTAVVRHGSRVRHAASEDPFLAALQYCNQLLNFVAVGGRQIILSVGFRETQLRVQLVQYKRQTPVDTMVPLRCCAEARNTWTMVQCAVPPAQNAVHMLIARPL